MDVVDSFGIERDFDWERERKRRVVVRSIVKIRNGISQYSIYEEIYRI